MATYTLSQLESALKQAIKNGDKDSALRIKSAIQNNEYDVADYDFSTTEMVKNIPSSAWNVAKDIGTAIAHPIQTGKGVVQLGQGVVEKLLPEQQTAEGGFNTPAMQTAEAAGRMLATRYGGIDEIKRTIQTDPVGALMDFSGLLGSMPSKVGQVGRLIDPMNAATKIPLKLAGQSTRIINPNMPRDWMKSAVKFPLDKRSTRPDFNELSTSNDRLAELMVKDGIMPTASGVNKAINKIKGLQSDIDKLISKATESGKTIPRSEVFKYIKEAKQKIVESGSGGTNELKTIDAFVKNLDDMWYNYEMKSFTPDQLQNFKIDLYDQIDFGKATMQISRGQDKAARVTAKAVREGIESLTDGDIANLNKLEGQYLELLDVLPQKVGRIENLNSMPLNVGAAAAGGASLDYIFGTPGIFATGMTAGSIFDRPKIKSRAAINLQRMKDFGLLDGNNVPPFAVKQGLFQSGRYENE